MVPNETTRDETRDEKASSSWRRSLDRGHDRYFGKYFSAAGAKNLSKYVYRGSDASLIYNHVTNKHVYPYLLEWVPTWVAPNIITLLGLLCTVVSHVLMAHHCPLMEGEAPAWVYVLNGVFFLMYQTLDALDGKQARRTGTSSPLGLLFDHGCDALNTTVSALTLFSTIQLGPTWLSFSLWGAGVIGFYAATWEEYYTGELALPVINGPNEGIVLTSFVHIFTAVVGPAWWLESSFGVERNVLFWGFSMVAAVLTIVYNVVNVSKAVLGNPDFSLPVALTRMTPFLLVVGMSASWVICSPSDIMAVHPRMVLWALGLLFSKLVTQLMIAHLCEEEYHPFGKTMSVILFLGVHAAFSLVKSYDSALSTELARIQLDEEVILTEFFAISFLTYSHLVVIAIWECTSILGIKCFTIPAPSTKKGN